ncbi:hypothetical protein V1260_12600 [Brachybacterium sp. J144]|uniref:hypothetical protein n=1 Tax=Brachybacterium sp. J144 TaxID=3116487 RepID=UPI002E781D36|nr:hypothetical protein [Brachybacterium sp. J144]MEE1651621.1 hypothetical protein [Brachybacterium sp. J144]
MNRGRVSVTPSRPLDRLAQDPPADGPLEICRPHADQEAGVDPRSREGREGREIRFLRVEAGTLAALSG